jgi:hypothetical protein
MNFCKETYKIFPFEEIELIEEKINSFRLIYILSSKPNIDISTIEKYLSHIPEEDDFEVLLQIEDDDPISLRDRKKANKFVSEYKSSFQYYEDYEKIKFSITIDKKKNKSVRNIYNLDSFKTFWKDISVMDLLTVLKAIKEQNEFLLFRYLEEEKEVFRTSNLCFGYKFPKQINNNNFKKIKENCHFGNFDEFPFTPDFFHSNNSNISNPIVNKLKILTSLFSILSIFDITSIKDNKLIYKLSGYKTFEGEIVIDNSFLSCSDIYYEIYEWIYSSDGNSTDKIGLVRNILSIYLEDDITKLDKNVLLSIKSAYKTYLKENVDRYIEIRNKIFDELSWVSQKSSEIVEKYLSNYQKSVFSFLSFFLSVFIIRVLKTGNFTDIFSKDATILSFAFLIISAVYLLFSKWTLNKEKNRLRRKYENIKKRYKDLLIEKDIEEILDNNREFDYEISFIEKRHNAYSWLWIITLIILLISILTISDYINWNIINETITNWFTTKPSG